MRSPELRASLLAAGSLSAQPLTVAEGRARQIEPKRHPLEELEGEG